MSMPNVGVTQVIQQPGIGGIIGQNLSSLAQTLMARQQAEQERLKNEAAIQYTNAQRRALEADLAAKAAEAEQTQGINTLLGRLQERVPSGPAQAIPTFGGAVMPGFQARPTRERTVAEVQALPEYKPELGAGFAKAAEPIVLERQWRETLDALSASRGGFLTPGEIAAYRAMGREKGAPELAKSLSPMAVGAEQRLLQRGPEGIGTLAGVDTTPKPVTRPSDVAEAMEVELGLPRDTPIESLSPGQRQRMDAYINRKVATGAARSTVNIASDTLASGLGKAAGDKIARTEVAASDASRDIEVIGQLRGFLREGMITGAGANALTSVGNALAQLGVGGDDIRDPVARTQAYSAIVGQRVGTIIKQFGSGTGLSDADRRYAERIAAGDISLTPQALTKILDISDRQNRWVIQQHNRSIDKLNVGEDVKSTLRVPLPESVREPTKRFNVDGRIIEGTLEPSTGRYFKLYGNTRMYLEEQ